MDSAPDFESGGWGFESLQDRFANQKKRHWFSGKIPRCQRGAPGSIPGWRIFSSCGAVGSASVLCADGPGFEPLHEHFWGSEGAVGAYPYV